MGMFGNGASLDADLKVMCEESMNALQESFFFYEVNSLPYEERARILASPEVKIMEERGLIGKDTRVRLSKNDDLERRIGMASLQMAKDEEDILYDKLLLNRVKEKELLAKIDKKYGLKASKVAKVGQKEYLQHKIPLGFMRK